MVVYVYFHQNVPKFGNITIPITSPQFFIHNQYNTDTNGIKVLTINFKMLTEIQTEVKQNLSYFVLNKF